ncbi:MAG: glutaredoxin domain-containing protein [Myxococcaceae bacterium]
MAPSGLFLAFLLFAAPAPSPLDAAKRHLAEGKLDEVLFDLEGKSFAEPERPGAAAVLAEAGRLGLEAKDPVLALQFAQMALRLDKKQPLALEVGARASLGQQQFDPAEDYSDRLMALDAKAPRPRLLRAEIALEEGEWAKVVDLTRGIEPDGLSKGDRARLREVVETASRELRERAEARSLSKELEKQLEAEVQRLKREPPAVSAPRRAAARKVIVYGAPWCGYCKKAAQWLSSRGIPFEEKDVEKDPEAARELAEKKRAAHRSGSGIPWIDAGGELISGFDERALERLFP